jgi:hypothetical protein
VPRRNRRHPRATVSKRRSAARSPRPSKCWLAGKLGYENEKLALAALDEVRAKRVRRGSEVIENRVYYHTACEMWHLTHTSPDDLASRREEF